MSKTSERAAEFGVDAAEWMNDNRDGWCEAMDLRFLRATADEVIAEMTIGPQHRQSFGIVHGGVHTGIVETLASVGAAVVALPRGQSVVGLENQTSFIRAMREGTLRGVAKPITRGRRTQVWEVIITDAEQHTVATGRVRLLCLDAGTPVAGEGIHTGKRAEK